MIDWTSWFSEIVANIRIAVPEVKTTGGGGIHDACVLERLSIEKIQAFPYCAVEIAQVPSEDWGLNNSAFEARVEVTLVAKVELGMPVLRARIDALRHQFLRQSAFTTATCLDCDELSLDASNRTTDILTRKGLSFLACSAVFSFVLFETVTDTPP